MASHSAEVSRPAVDQMSVAFLVSSCLAADIWTYQSLVVQGWVNGTDSLVFRSCLYLVQASSLVAQALVGIRPPGPC